MPGMKGSDLLRWMKEQEDLKDMPFIMVTAHNEKDIIMDAVNQGITDFIIKPINVDALVKKVSAALRDIISKKVKK
jgi:DNA-binding response OmpR family regulator